MALLSHTTPTLHQPFLPQNVLLPPDIPLLYLPPVDYSTLFSELVSMGVPSEVASELCKSHHRRLSELSSKFLDVHTRTCNELLSLWHHTSQNIHFRDSKDQLETAYRQTVEEWKTHLLNTVSTHFSPIQTRECNKSRKSGFNYEFIPALEQFFSVNHNPSPADKTYLAKQGGMTYRQIHIWFQNQRRRSKKLAPTQYRTPSLKDPDQSVKTSDASCSSLSGVKPKGTSDTSLKPYVHGSGLKRFPRPVWMRLPSQSYIEHSRLNKPDMDALIDGFRYLSIEDGTSCPRSACSLNQFKPSIFEPGGLRRSIPLYPPPAPLPSLIGPLSYLLHDQLPSNYTSPNSFRGSKACHDLVLCSSRYSNKRPLPESERNIVNLDNLQRGVDNYAPEMACPPAKRMRQSYSIPKRLPRSKPKLLPYSPSNVSPTSSVLKLPISPSSTPPTPTLTLSDSSRSPSFSSIIFPTPADDYTSPLIFEEHYPAPSDKVSEVRINEGLMTIGADLPSFDLRFR